MKIRTKILNDVRLYLTENLGDIVKDIILFGSQATGKTNKNSDYDFLIVLKEQYNWKLKNEISNICYQIDLKYNIITDIHIISEYELHNTLRGFQPIFQNALKNGIHLC